jgi:hypothetical protein
MAMPGTAHLNPENTPTSSGSMTPSHSRSTGSGVQKDSLIGHTLAKAMSLMPDGDPGSPDPRQASDSDLDDSPDGDAPDDSVVKNGPLVDGGGDPQNEQEEASNQDIADELSESSDDDDEPTQAKYLKNKERQVAAQKRLEEVNKGKWANLADALEMQTKSKSKRTGKGETQKASTKSNAQPVNSQSSVSPSLSFDNQDDWPKWLRTAVLSLSDEGDHTWTSFLTKFIAFERHLGFPEKMVFFFRVCSSAC